MATTFTKAVVDETSMTKIADAIREKGNTSDGLTFPDGMISAIENLTFTSVRKNGVVEASTFQEFVTIPLNDLSKLQVVHLCLLDTETIQSPRVQTLTMTLTDNSVDGYSIVSVIDSTGLSRSTIMTDSNFDNYRYYVTLTKNSNTINIEIDSDMLGHFYGSYAYEIFGG